MTYPSTGTVTTNGFEVCGTCHKYLSVDNPGLYEDHRWTCAACLVAALLRIEQAMEAREARGK